MGGTKAIGKFRVRIKSVHIHPRYKNENGIKSFDICVIKTVRKIEYKDSLRPLCLADRMPEDGTILYTAGWPSKSGGAKKPAKIIMEEVLS